MDVKMIQAAFNAAISLDIENANEHLNMDLDQHVEAFHKLAPHITKAILALAKLNVDKIQAEMN